MNYKYYAGPVKGEDAHLETTINWQWATAASTRSTESSWKPVIQKTISIYEIISNYNIIICTQTKVESVRVTTTQPTVVVQVFICLPHHTKKTNQHEHIACEFKRVKSFTFFGIGKLAEILSTSNHLLSSPSFKCSQHCIRLQPILHCKNQNNNIINLWIL